MAEVRPSQNGDRPGKKICGFTSKFSFIFLFLHFVDAPNNPKNALSVCLKSLIDYNDVFLEYNQGHGEDAARGSSKVFLQRDYSRGTACRFQNKFPPELKNKVFLSLSNTF